MKLKDLSDWHRWFAWRPVRLEGPEGDTRWLEFVERRHSYGIGYKYPYYRALT